MSAREASISNLLAGRSQFETNVMESGWLRAATDAPYLPADTLDAVRRKEEAAFLNWAQAQLEDDFQYMQRMTVVNLWTTLEVFIDDLVIAWILAYPDAVETERKVPLNRILRSSGEDRAALVLEEIKQDAKSAFQSGVSHFESIFKLVGLGGQVSDEIRAYLFELGQIRNLLVHKGGVPDSRFLEACPGWTEIVDDRIRLSAERCQQYCIYSLVYVQDVYERTCDLWPELSKMRI